MTLYNLHTDGDQYRITKLTNDLEVESSYLMTAAECECPAGHRPTCRHRQMFADLLPLCDTMWFWDFKRKAVVDIHGFAKAIYDTAIDAAFTAAEGLPAEPATLEPATPSRPWRRL